MIGHLYEELYCCFSEISDFPHMAHFVAMKGKYFDTNEKRLMLVGRSVNGWGSLTASSAEEFGMAAESQFTDLSRWSGWVDDKEGRMYSKNDPSYSLDRSPFWAYSKEVFNRIPGSAVKNTGIWMENIVWSNLYKVSPPHGGNPSNNLLFKQNDICRKILECEIAELRPTHILFMTGYDWIYPFQSIFDTLDFWGKNKNRGNNKTEHYVEGKASIDGIPVVITCRPEYRDKTKFVEQVMRGFDNGDADGSGGI